jgi:hypothetical protein
MTNASLFYAITLCSSIHFAVRSLSQSSKLNNMQKKDLGVLRHENWKEGNCMNKSIYLIIFPYYPLKFYSGKYLTHLEIIRKGENFAN